MYGDYAYPWWVEMFGWFLASISIIPIPVVGFYKIITAKGNIYEVQ